MNLENVSDSTECAPLYDQSQIVSIWTEPEIDTIVTTPEPVLLHSCPLCDFTTQSLSAYNQHLKSHKQCVECGETFQGENSTRDYKNHLKKHLKGKTTYNCQVCEKTFPSRPYLNRHMKRSHHSNSAKKIDLEFEDDYPTVTNQMPQSSEKKSRRKQSFK